MDLCSTSVLQPGAILSACRILRGVLRNLPNDAAGAEPYVMEFRCDGHRYTCPLFAFQPRTQSLTGVVEAEPVDDAVAVAG